VVESYTGQIAYAGTATAHVEIDDLDASDWRGTPRAILLSANAPPVWLVGVRLLDGARSGDYASAELRRGRPGFFAGREPFGPPPLGLSPETARWDVLWDGHPADRAAAEAAIKAVFEVVYSSSTPDELRQGAIEGGADLAAMLAESRRAREQFRGTPEMSVVVDRVRLLGHDEAEVFFVLLFSKGPLPRLECCGAAVRVRDEWKVARETFCAQVQSLGVRCPPAHPG
jgi:hypothetical protein